MPSPKDPNKYLGPNVYTGVDVIRNRSPGLPDYRQPETGRNYELMTIWQVSKDPTSGVEGDLWILSKIVANQGYWVKIASGVTPSGGILTLSDTANTLVFPTVGGNIQLEGSAGIAITSVPLSNKLTFALTGGSGAIDSIQVDALTAPGVNPVMPTALGLMTISGTSVASHAVPIETRTRALNAFNIEVQLASEQVASSQTNAGLASFSNTQFDVDAAGFVTLLGSTNPAVTQFNVDAHTAPGTDPVLASSTGLINITGAQVASGVVGTNVIRTDSLAANTITVEIQRSTAVAASDVTKNGVAHFNSAQFSVDSDGFVSSTVSPGGSWVLIETKTGAASSELIFNTSLSNYTELMFNWFAITTAAGTAYQLSADNGSTLISGEQGGVPVSNFGLITAAGLNWGYLLIQNTPGTIGRVATTFDQIAANTPITIATNSSAKINWVRIFGTITGDINVFGR